MRTACYTILFLIGCSSDPAEYLYSERCFESGSNADRERCFVACTSDMDKISDEGADWVTACGAECYNIVCKGVWAVNRMDTSGNWTPCKNTSAPVKAQCRRAGWDGR